MDGIGGIDAKLYRGRSSSMKRIVRKRVRHSKINCQACHLSYRVFLEDRIPRVAISCRAMGSEEGFRETSQSGEFLRSSPVRMLESTPGEAKLTRIRRKRTRAVRCGHICCLGLLSYVAQSDPALSKGPVDGANIWSTVGRSTRHIKPLLTIYGSYLAGETSPRHIQGGTSAAHRSSTEGRSCSDRYRYVLARLPHVRRKYRLTRQNIDKIIRRMHKPQTPLSFLRYIKVALRSLCRHQP